MACPLCGCDTSGPFWLGATSYRGSRFDYVQCRSCDTIFCDPMPSDETLAQMYGMGYSESFIVDPNVDDPKEPYRTIEWLSRIGKGTFIDYGCGDGSLLGEAAKLGWRPYGVEFDPEVARRAEGKTGLKVFSDPSALLKEAGSPADVLHLGDVIEHLTALDRQMCEIMQLVKRGGVILAQGPLEGNPTLFSLALRLSRSARGRRSGEGAPYHVLLATAAGQRTFFRRFGLEELEYSIHEVSWPAPRRLSVPDLVHPRTLGLFALSRLSRWISGLGPGKLGNRYFYAGRRVG
jgi:SAM-dependent methyltransferase